MEIIVILTVFIVVFYMIIKGSVERNLAIMYGAAAITLLGMIFGSYSPIRIIQSVNFETLFLLFGMMLYSTVMVKTGLFEQWAQRISGFAKNDPWLIVVCFSLITFGLSLFVNNLTTIVVILPITLILCSRIGIRPIPVVITEVIVSNLGGASSMVGDFPNMLIGSSTPYNFIDFFTYMLPVCLLGVGALMFYLYAKKTPLL
ncbi:MAG: sodium:proton antiporter, partial [Nitrospinae bacterium]|nr:sodium:proton antiporter [Nitrospinota bacterium]